MGRDSHVRLNALRGSPRITRRTKDASLIAVASVKSLANVSLLLKYSSMFCFYDVQGIVLLYEIIHMPIN